MSSPLERPLRGCSFLLLVPLSHAGTLPIMGLVGRSLPFFLRAPLGRLAQRRATPPPPPQPQASSVPSNYTDPLPIVRDSLGVPVPIPKLYMVMTAGKRRPQGSNTIQGESSDEEDDNY